MQTLVCFIIISGCRKNEDSLQLPQIAFSEQSNNIISVANKDLILPESDDFASIPQDPRNPLSSQKVQLGQLLFHESRLGGNPKFQQGLFTYSCATCHHSEAGFQSGLAQAIGEGGIGFGLTGEGRVPSAINTSSVDVQPLRTPTALNTAFQEVMLWSGGMGSTGINAGTQALWKGVFANNSLGFEGLETQAITAISVHRMKVDTPFFKSNATYKNLFDQAFSSLSSNQRISPTTVGLAMAAYERTLLSNQSPFQRWLRGEKNAMTAEEKEGGKLFFGKAKCNTCHTGPALNSMQFFALGMDDLRNGVNGVINLKSNPEEDKGRGQFTQKAGDNFKFKVPQLYNLKDVQFFGHGASFGSVTEVVQYFNKAVPQNPKVPGSQLAKEFKPLNLTNDEIAKIVKFIENALYDPNLTRYEPANVPSGNCIPNNDLQSRKDRGCQ